MARVTCQAHGSVSKSSSATNLGVAQPLPLPPPPLGRCARMRQRTHTCRSAKEIHTAPCRAAGNTRQPLHARVARVDPRIVQLTLLLISRSCTTLLARRCRHS